MQNGIPAQGENQSDLLQGENAYQPSDNAGADKWVQSIIGPQRPALDELNIIARLHDTQRICRLIGRYIVATRYPLSQARLQVITTKISRLTGIWERIVRKSLISSISKNRQSGPKRAQELLEQGLAGRSN
jgi:hypothetical protein